jgi:hypothetical protein
LNPIRSLGVPPQSSHEARGILLGMKVFEILEARWAGLDANTTAADPRWVLKGRAHEDVGLGDTLMLGAAKVTVEAIRTYGKESDLLSRMMTGEIVVRWVEEESMFYLTR